jgi:hypothetical protein
MRVAVPKEVRPGERRVAVTPETVVKLKKLGFEVLIESGAGDGAAFDDPLYVEAGATIVDGARELWAQAELVLKVNPPELNTKLGVHEAELLPEGKVLISFIWPAKAEELIEHHSRAEDGCLEFDGEHRRLPGGDRGGELLWSLLYRANDGRRQGATRKGLRDWGWRCGPLRDWSGQGAWRYRPSVRHQASRA